MVFLRVEYLGFNLIRLQIQPATLGMSLSSANVPVMPLHLTDGFFESFNSSIRQSCGVGVSDALPARTIVYLL